MSHGAPTVPGTGAVLGEGSRAGMQFWSSCMDPKLKCHRMRCAALGLLVVEGVRCFAPSHMLSHGPHREGRDRFLFCDISSVLLRVISQMQVIKPALTFQIIRPGGQICVCVFNFLGPRKRLALDLLINVNICTALKDLGEGAGGLVLTLHVAEPSSIPGTANSAPAPPGMA